MMVMHRLVEETPHRSLGFADPFLCGATAEGNRAPLLLIV